MKKFKCAAAFALCLSALGMASCGNQLAKEISEGPAFVEKPFVDFTQGQPSVLTSSDGWCNGGPFGVTWKAANNTFDEENGCRMSVTKEGDEFYGSELKSLTEGFDFFQYGYFGVYMKPSNEVGTASTFFTYTGESDNGNPHDEIDIEFLGKDTTKVQFNWFVNGKGGHEHLYNLGFDASQGFHQYGFLWQEDCITWYVDLKPVYETRYDIPKTPQRIFQNFWSGNRSDLGIMNWMGKVNDDHLPVYCYSKSITYADLSGKGKENIPEPVKPKTVEDLPLIEGGLNWTGNEVYTISDLDGKNGADISYTGVTQDYSNIAATLPEASKTANTFAMKIENAGTESATVRLDLNMDAPLVEGGLRAANSKGYYADGTEVRTDKEWGGSYFDIPAGETKVCAVEYYGPASSVMAMIDSTREGTHNGHLKFSEYRLGGVNEYVAPDPVDPGQEEQSDSSPITVSFNSQAGYTVSAVEGGFNVAYTDMAGNSYSNITSALSATELADADSISLKIKNNGTGNMQIRVDLNKLVGEDRTCLNSKAIGTGGLNSIRTDLEWGGSYAKLSSGQEGVFRVYFSAIPDELMIFIDSSQYDDATTHTGAVVLTEFAAVSTPAA